MIKYEIAVKQVSMNRFAAKITANGKKFVDCGIHRNQNDARLEANSTLTKVEQINGDWMSDHTTATYHYLPYPA